jgi:RimJ/RimL family protein N-acetyltransferase
MILLLRGETCVHRTLLIPGFFRFPFMAANDIQCGDIWTLPAERGKGLALVGLSVAIRRAWQPGRRIWYLTDESNKASNQLARRAGFLLLGNGRRTRRLGLKLLGEFVVTTVAQNAR